RDRPHSVLRRLSLCAECQGPRLSQSDLARVCRHGKACAWQRGCAPETQTRLTGLVVVWAKKLGQSTATALIVGKLIDCLPLVVRAVATALVISERSRSQEALISGEIGCW